ncbi:MAG: anti-sigma regulatory factor [bacterium]
MRREVWPLTTARDIADARRAVHTIATQRKFRTSDAVRLSTAASELARNVVIHGGGGEMLLEVVTEGARQGISLTFKDRGPGIADIDTAMKDGFSTAGSLGHGLGGARRLVDRFELESAVGEGTRVKVVRWLR